ncbi:MAG: hypothetical protein LBS95_01960 [Mycoplasmataceae bacterium]|jgi:ATPase subunit of ABC transporter with duplicated ATPase domains|nr:hypothetical protein [Mycoplasmataceae bacterium]
MKDIKGKFKTVQGNKNFDGKEFSAQVEVVKQKPIGRNGKSRTSNVIKKSSKLDLILNRMDQIDTRLGKIDARFNKIDNRLESLEKFNTEQREFNKMVLGVFKRNKLK